MDVVTEQCYAVKFCVRLTKLKVEMITLLKEAFQNETLRYSTIRRWLRTFTGGRESAETEHVRAEGELLRQMSTSTQCRWWLKKTIIHACES